MWMALLIVVGIVSGIVQIKTSQEPITRELASRILLLHQFVVAFGLVGIIGVITNVLYAEQEAAKLGWPGGPFQIKYGFAQLGIGVLGVMAIWFKDHFWVAALVNMYVYGLSGLWTHTLPMIQNQKFNWNDGGSILLDIAYMALLTALSISARIW